MPLALPQKQLPSDVQAGTSHLGSSQMQYFSHQLPYSSVNINNTGASSTQQLNQPAIQREQQQKLVPTTIFLINAHRVGMRAMDSMGLRNADDCRSFSKYSRIPMFCDEICWLFEEVSVQLGDVYVHSFCEKVSTCVASPFLLFHLVKESIKVIIFLLYFLFCFFLVF